MSPEERAALIAWMYELDKKRIENSRKLDRPPQRINSEYYTIVYSTIV